jgi:hypothetical protein
MPLPVDKTGFAVPDVLRERLDGLTADELKDVAMYYCEMATTAIANIGLVAALCVATADTPEILQEGMSFVLDQCAIKLQDQLIATNPGYEKMIGPEAAANLAEFRKRVQEERLQTAEELGVNTKIPDGELVN